MNSNESNAYYRTLGLLLGGVRGLFYGELWPKRPAGVWIFSALLSIHAIAPIALVAVGPVPREAGFVVPALIVLVIFGCPATALLALRRCAVWMLGGGFTLVVGLTLLRDGINASGLFAVGMLGCPFLYALWLHRKGVLR